MENARLLVRGTKQRKQGLGQTRGRLSVWRTDWCPWIPARFVLAVMVFLGFVNVYILRVNLSMTLIVMINDSVSSSSNTSDKIQHHPVR